MEALSFQRSYRFYNSEKGAEFAETSHVKDATSERSTYSRNLYRNVLAHHLKCLFINCQRVLRCLLLQTQNISGYRTITVADDQYVHGKEYQTTHMIVTALMQTRQASAVRYYYNLGC